MFVAFKAFAVNACESLNSSPFVGLYKRPTNAHRKTPFAWLALRFTNDEAVARKLKKAEEKEEGNSGVGSLLSVGGVSTSLGV